MKRVVDPVPGHLRPQPAHGRPGRRPRRQPGLLGVRDRDPRPGARHDRRHLGRLRASAPAAAADQETGEPRRSPATASTWAAGSTSPTGAPPFPGTPISGSTASPGRPGAHAGDRHARDHGQEHRRSIVIDAAAGQGDLQRQARRADRRAALGHAPRLRRSAADLRLADGRRASPRRFAAPAGSGPPPGPGAGRSRPGTGRGPGGPSSRAEGARAARPGSLNGNMRYSWMKRVRSTSASAPSGWRRCQPATFGSQVARNSAYSSLRASRSQQRAAISRSSSRPPELGHEQLEPAVGLVLPGLGHLVPAVVGRHPGRGGQRPEPQPGQRLAQPVAARPGRLGNAVDGHAPLPRPRFRRPFEDPLPAGVEEVPPLVGQRCSGSGARPGSTRTSPPCAGGPSGRARRPRRSRTGPAARRAPGARSPRRRSGCTRRRDRRRSTAASRRQPKGCLD